MLDWMNPMVFLQTLVKVAIVWMAFYGAGHIAELVFPIRKSFPLLPKEISGALFLILLEIPLSLLGILNRTVTPIILLLFAVPGMLLLLKKVKKSDKPGKASIGQVIGVIALLAVGILNLTYASAPNIGFDDPLITYAVQPDRWLNSGSIHWIEETVFSGFPLTYEMMSVWPASLSSDRLDQLSVLQVFQVTLLFFALFRGMHIIGIKKKYRIPLAITILLCSLLYYWSSLAKTDTAAILFSTLALTAVIREMSDRSLKPYSSWFLMGLALATKQTSVIVLLPFLLYGGYRINRSTIKTKLFALVCLSFLPAVFGLRTMLKTGSPTYPVHQISFLVKDEWRLIQPPAEIIELNDRDSQSHSETDYGFLKNIGIFFISMEGILFLLLGGVVIAFIQKDNSRVLFMPILVYFTVAIILFWPPWWGVKYAILIFPFVALLGVRSMQSRERFSSVFLPLVSILSFVVPGYLVTSDMFYPANFKLSLTRSVLTGEWDISSGYQFNINSSEGMTQMWLNSDLSQESRILSLHEEKRYFCDHQIFVGWRHPATQELYLENSLEEECAILNDLDIEFVTFYRSDPCLFQMENRLAILDHVGQNDILEPVISVSGGYTICRYNPPEIGMDPTDS